MENRRRFVGVHDSSGSLREWERRLFEAERRQSRGRNTRLHLSRPPTPCGLAVLEHLISRLLDTLKNDQSHLGHLLIWVMSFTFAVLEIKTNNLNFLIHFKTTMSLHVTSYENNYILQNNKNYMSFIVLIFTNLWYLAYWQTTGFL